MSDCDAIAELWALLNPSCRMEGCWIDPAGSVQIYVWYSGVNSATGEKETHPLELCLGNPPRTVIRGLRQAYKMQAAGRRLVGVAETKGERPEAEALNHAKIEI